jgi:hypothetical protein
MVRQEAVTLLRMAVLRPVSWRLSNGDGRQPNPWTKDHFVDVSGGLDSGLSVMVLDAEPDLEFWSYAHSDIKVRTLCGRSLPDTNDGRWMEEGGIEYWHGWSAAHRWFNACRACIDVALTRPHLFIGDTRYECKACSGFLHAEQHVAEIGVTDADRIAGVRADFAARRHSGASAQ